MHSFYMMTHTRLPQVKNNLTSINLIFKKLIYTFPNTAIQFIHFPRTLNLMKT